MTEVINASHLVKFYPDLLIEYSLSYSWGALTVTSPKPKSKLKLKKYLVFLSTPSTPRAGVMEG